MSRRRRRQLPREPFRCAIESLSHEGRGVTHVDGKTVFVDGALPGEEVMAVLSRRQRRFDEARTVEVLSAAPERVPAKCEHFGICGGCSLQHLEPAAQIRAKQQVLLDGFRHLGGGIEPEILAEPITGPVWGYRRKARLGVKFVTGKGRVLVGFREKASPYLADLQRCEVLHAEVGSRLTLLAEFIGGLEACRRIPQIEVAVADNATVLAFRHLDPLGEHDLLAFRELARETGLHIWLQPAGPASVTPLTPEDSQPVYRIDAFNLEYAFLPTDFTQVNRDINQAMVARALDWLDVGAGHRVLDLFCGLGNFTLPLAQRCARVVGVEGEAGLVERARHNACRNGIDNAEFHVADLSEDHNRGPRPAGHWLHGRYDRILLDPARSGALEMMSCLPGLDAGRIVYVSCNPATLARDAGELVNRHGYRLRRAGVMDMFPHTAHIESIALFEKA